MAGALALALPLLVAVPSRAGTNPVVLGTPVPTRPPGGQPAPEKSRPLDTGHYSRRALAGDARALKGALPPGYSLTDVVVANTDPNLTSTDTFGDSEPSLAVNGANTNEQDIYTFSSSWSSNGNAAVWHTSNGGTTWSKKFTVPKPTGVTPGTGCPCDVTLDFDRSSHLFGTFLDEQSAGGDIYTGDTSDPTSTAAWQWFAPGGVAQKTDTLGGGADDADQPWLRVNRDPIAAQDNAYVGYDDFTSPVTIQVAVALGSRPPNFTVNHSPGIPGCCVNPGTRLATDPSNGAMYVIWQFATGINPNGSVAVRYAMSRSTNAGATWSLNGSSSGIVVASANSNQPTPKFGTVNALLGGVDAAAVDPTNHDVYLVYGNKDGVTGKNRLAIRRLTDNGTGGLNIGAEHFVTGQVQAALPSVAVASNGAVGVLYDTYDGNDAGGFPIFSAHLAQSTDRGTTFSDTTLVSFLSPSKDNGNARQRVLGDYQQLRVVGNTFFGVFPANGAAFGRSLANIDPIVLKAPALAQPPVVGISPSSGPKGTSVGVLGGHFAPGETVNVKYKTGLTSPRAVLLCSATVGANGTFGCQGNIPTTNQGALGAYSIVAKGLTSLLKAKTTFTVTN